MSSQSNQSLQPESKSQSNQIPWWVTSICIVTAVGAVSYKFIIGNFNLDFNAFLSLVLALFSILLSAMFYFKATDTSNKFYNNIYNFTKDIAQLLVKIESSFGQQLKSIDERQLKMNDWVYNGKMSEHEIEKTEDEIDKQKVELERINNEQQEIIDKLIEEAKMKDDEKEQIKNELAENKRQYSRTKDALNILQVKLMSNEELDKISSIQSWFNPDEHYYIKEFTNKIINKFGMQSTDKASIVNFFSQAKKYMPQKYLNLLDRRGFVRDGELTDTGILFYLGLILELNKKDSRLVNISDNGQLL